MTSLYKQYYLTCDTQNKGVVFYYSLLKVHGNKACTADLTSQNTKAPQGGVTPKAPRWGIPSDPLTYITKKVCFLYHYIVLLLISAQVSIETWQKREFLSTSMSNSPLFFTVVSNQG